jgi:hypothetical protein
METDQQPEQAHSHTEGQLKPNYNMVDQDAFRERSLSKCGNVKNEIILIISN